MLRLIIMAITWLIVLGLMWVIIKTVVKPVAYLILVGTLIGGIIWTCKELNKKD